MAKTSLGSSSTGWRFVVATAAPVSMFVEPGPTEALHAMACNRLSVRAKPTEACTMPCSLRAR